MVIVRSKMLDISIQSVLVLGVAYLAGSKRFIHHFSGASRKELALSALLGNGMAFGISEIWKAEQDGASQKVINIMISFSLGAFCTNLITKGLKGRGSLSIPATIKFVALEVCVIGLFVLIPCDVFPDTSKKEKEFAEPVHYKNKDCAPPQNAGSPLVGTQSPISGVERGSGSNDWDTEGEASFEGLIEEGVEEVRGEGRSTFSPLRCDEIPLPETVQGKNKNSVHPQNADSLRGGPESPILEEEIDFNLEQLNSTLLWAAALGNADLVKSLVEQGVSTDIQNENGFTPLHLAAEKGSIEVIEVLASIGNIDGVQWASLLCWATQEGYIKTVKALLERGVDPNTPEENGLTPLHIATKYGHLDIVQFLLVMGANKDAQDKKGCLPLHFAVNAESLDIAKVLLEKGANTDIQNEKGWAPLHLAAQTGLFDFVDTLLKLGCKVDVNIKGKGGLTPLHLAAQEQHTEVVEVLLEHEADKDIKDKNFCTPLHYAVNIGSIDVVRALSVYEGEINSKNQEEQTPLHLAAKHGHLDIVQFLLFRGANEAAQDGKGQTPLHLAVLGNHTEVMAYLSRRGSNAHTLNTQGDSPIDIARSKNIMFGGDIAKFFPDDSLPRGPLNLGG